MSSNTSTQNFYGNFLFALIASILAGGIAWLYNEVRGEWEGWAVFWAICTWSMTFAVLNGPVGDKIVTGARVTIQSIRGPGGVKQKPHSSLFQQAKGTTIQAVLSAIRSFISNWRIAWNQSTGSSQQQTTNQWQPSYAQQQASPKLDFEKVLEWLRTSRGWGKQTAELFDQAVNLYDEAKREVNSVSDREIQKGLKKALTDDWNILQSDALKKLIIEGKHGEARPRISEIISRFEFIRDKAVEFEQGTDNAQATGTSGYRYQKSDKDKIEDACQLLGVSESASIDEIKAARNEKAKEFHPDSNPGDSGEMMKRINIAYDVLSNPERFNQKVSG